MRGFAFGFAVAVFLVVAGPLLAENWVRVVPGNGGDLSARVLLLERAVEQLQRRETSPPAVAVSEGRWSCALKTPFDGTFSASDATESAARAGVMSACKAKGQGNLYCEEKSVECGKK